VIVVFSAGLTSRCALSDDCEKN